MRHCQCTFRPNNKEDRHTCFIAVRGGEWCDYWLVIGDKLRINVRSTSPGGSTSGRGLPSPTTSSFYVEVIAYIYQCRNLKKTQL